MGQFFSAFGIETSFEDAKIVLIPVPWEATASYGGGTSEGPSLIRKASFQLDFFQKEYQSSYNHLIHFLQEDSDLRQLNQEALSLSQKIKEEWVEDKALDIKDKKIVDKVNQLCQQMIYFVYKEVDRVCKAGKIPVIVGGDHSVSEGALDCVGLLYKGDYGVLHIDAHHDLRVAYQGFQHSHASVMYNVLNQKNSPKKLVQVGIRDFSKEEYELAEKDCRIHCYYDEDNSHRLFEGATWADLCREMVSHLPSQVYISLDVDGLSWEWAPGTGTPVPGGLSYQKTLFLFKELKNQNKKIIGFDVVETSSGEKSSSLSFQEWNGNVSARLIYSLAGLSLYS